MKGPVFKNKDLMIFVDQSEREDHLFDTLRSLKIGQRYKEIEDIILGPNQSSYSDNMNNMMFEDDDDNIRIWADEETRWRLYNLKSVTDDVIGFGKVTRIIIKEWVILEDKPKNPDPMVGDVKYIELNVDKVLWKELLRIRRVLGFISNRDCLKSAVTYFVRNRCDYIERKN